MKWGNVRQGDGPSADDAADFLPPDDGYVTEYTTGRGNHTPVISSIRDADFEQKAKGGDDPPKPSGMQTVANNAVSQIRRNPRFAVAAISTIATALYPGTAIAPTTENIDTPPGDVTILNPITAERDKKLLEYEREVRAVTDIFLKDSVPLPEIRDINVNDLFGEIYSRDIEIKPTATAIETSYRYVSGNNTLINSTYGLSLGSAERNEDILGFMAPRMQEILEILSALHAFNKPSRIPAELNVGHYILNAKNTSVDTSTSGSGGGKIIKDPIFHKYPASSTKYEVTTSDGINYTQHLLIFFDECDELLTKTTDKGGLHDAKNSVKKLRAIAELAEENVEYEFLTKALNISPNSLEDTLGRKIHNVFRYNDGPADLLLEIPNSTPDKQKDQELTQIRMLRAGRLMDISAPKDFLDPASALRLFLLTGNVDPYSMFETENYGSEGELKISVVVDEVNNQNVLIIQNEQGEQVNITVNTETLTPSQRKDVLLKELFVTLAHITRGSTVASIEMDTMLKMDTTNILYSYYEAIANSSSNYSTYESIMVSRYGSDTMLWPDVIVKSPEQFDRIKRLLQIDTHDSPDEARGNNLSYFLATSMARSNKIDSSQIDRRYLKYLTERMNFRPIDAAVLTIQKAVTGAAL